jgi:hypothetical protein
MPLLWGLKAMGDYFYKDVAPTALLGTKIFLLRTKYFWTQKNEKINVAPWLLISHRFKCIILTVSRLRV